MSASRGFSVSSNGRTAVTGREASRGQPVGSGFESRTESSLAGRIVGPICYAGSIPAEARYGERRSGAGCLRSMATVIVLGKRGSTGRRG